MRTVALAKLLSSMQPGTALMGICFTPHSLCAAVTTRHLHKDPPKDVPQSATLDPDSLLRVVKELQVSSSYALPSAVACATRLYTCACRLGD